MDDLTQGGAAPPNADSLAALIARVEQLELAVRQMQGGSNAQASLQPASLAPASPLAPVSPRAPFRAPAGAPPPPIPQEPVGQDEMPRILSSAPAPAPRMPARPAAPAKSLEDRLGSQVFNLIGIVALIAGSAWALKLAIEHGYVGPVARVLIGIAAGVGLVIWSEFFRRKGVKAFSYSLKAVGSAVLYLTLWAAFQLYHLVPATVALSLMILVTAWNAFMAWTQDSEVLAWYALLGGFSTPLLLSTGGNHETFLFTYVAAIDMATVLLLRSKPWRLLLLPCFLATFAFFFGWYTEWFARTEHGWDAQSTETALFALLFAGLFAAASFRGKAENAPQGKQKAAAAVDVLLPLANAVFLSTALSAVLEESGQHALLPWLMVALAACYLGLMQLQRNAVARAMHLAVAVVFLTIAIPLKASGHTLTTAWLVEGLVLFWASTRFQGEEGDSSRTATHTLWVLSCGGYLLGLSSLMEHWFISPFQDHVQFLNHDLGAAVVALATLGGAVWLAVHHARPTRELDDAAMAALVAMDGVALLLILRELGSAVTGEQHTPFSNAPFLTSLLGLAVLAGVAYVSLRLAQRQPLRFKFAGGVGLGTIAGFNLFAILCIEREISALWPQDTSNLQRSLAISGFLMLYGSVLLAVGFWKRTAFIRWQALVLLLFTICKVFLYDTGSLSAGYRVASFMGLGAVLMAISYAYQKDWLGLKTVPALDVPPSPQEREA